MSRSDRPKLPPVRIVRIAEAVRAGIANLNRKLVPAPVGVLEMATGFASAQALFAAARLGVADALADGPLSPSDIAARIGTDPDATARLLRYLASFSVFGPLPDGRYELTSMSEALRTDSPTSVRPLLTMLGHPSYWGAWGQLEYSMQSGAPSIDKLHGRPLFEHLQKDVEFGAVFNAGMTCVAEMNTPPILSAYDFTKFATIVDVGGGQGSLLASILRDSPDSRGVLFELESVARDARPVIDEAGVADRCSIEVGSFFESVPTGADLYLLMHIVHDWNDEKALEILQNVRASIEPGGTLLVIEDVIPEGNRPHAGKMLDLDMLLFVGGKERTAAEYRDLLGRAGFRLTRIVPTVAPACLVEAVPA